MTRIRIFSSWVLFLLVYIPAQEDGQQVKTGTAVVMFFSHGYVVFAAESRVTLAGKSTLYSDDACKVRAMRNKFIFASAGVNAFGPEPGKNGNAWSAYDEPGKLVDQLPDMDDPVYGLAELWVKSLEQHVNRALVVNPEPMMDWLRKDGGETLSTGMFAGRTKQGQLVIYKAVLNCNCAGNQRRTSHSIFLVPFPPVPAGEPWARKKHCIFWTSCARRVVSALEPQPINLKQITPVRGDQKC
jgi:hypothetical protein